jgi:hypothetical protein
MVTALQLLQSAFGSEEEFIAVFLATSQHLRYAAPRTPWNHGCILPGFFLHSYHLYYEGYSQSYAKMLEGAGARARAGMRLPQVGLLRLGPGALYDLNIEVPATSYGKRDLESADPTTSRTRELRDVANLPLVFLTEALH